ncbi:MAG: helix-turn-helix domain-containing protein [Deltaproteobacteria bacterium]|nr:helix-turn-helix domain-containing protein [Deltaproteobacteria bacterium]
MARPAVEAASPSTLAPALLRWIAERGGDVSAYAEPAALDRDELPFTARALAGLLRVASEIVVEPHVSLRLPTELAYRRYDAVALACRAAKSPEEVLRIHARWAALVFPELEAEVKVEPEGIRFEAWVRGQPRGLGSWVDEYVVALVLARCRRGGASVAARSVALVSARPRDLAPLYEAFGTREIAFGSERCAIELAIDVARRELPGGDAAMVATAEQMAEAAMVATPRSGRLRDLVAAKIEAALPGDTSADAIAASLHMSARTMQRRLESEGTRFGEVLDQARELRSRRLLDDATLPLAEVAYRAGFADLATFSRAFKRWTSLTPGAYRHRDRDRVTRPKGG